MVIASTSIERLERGLAPVRKESGTQIDMGISTNTEECSGQLSLISRANCILPEKRRRRRWKGNAMAECKHDFLYDELHRQIVCVKCGYVLTDKDKQELHKRAFELMEAEAALKGGIEDVD